MKKNYNTLFLLIICCVLANPVLAQQTEPQKFDSALQFYEKQQYKRAAQMFESLSSEQAQLFAGKSYYGAADFIKAQTILTKVSTSSDPQISGDARYTLALANTQLKIFDTALRSLYSLKQEKTPTAKKATRLYQELLQYLSPNQRKRVYQSITTSEIRFDLMEAFFNQVDYNLAVQLFKAFSSTNTKGVPPLKLERIKNNLSDSLTFQRKYKRITYPDAPNGISYNIGVALPKFEEGSNEYDISRNLYLGFLLAAEEFNQRNTDKKVFLKFENTLSEEQNAAHLLTRFVWYDAIDVVLGPLFSESVLEMDQLSEEYQIPIIAPLANSDTLADDNPFLFQVNPTFAERGERMAEFAVNNLGLDTLAVLAEKNSLGAKSAYSFRARAEELGAFVPYLFVDNFEEKGYDLSDYSNYFSKDSTLIDSLNIFSLDGVYAPFTGEGAPVLIDLFMTDLQFNENYLPVLGSAEWSRSELTEEQIEQFNIYHIQGFEMHREKPGVETFIETYENRFSFEPDRFSLIGYDTANFTFRVLEMVNNPAYLKEGIKKYPMYNGLSTNIRFSNTHVNQFIEVIKLK